MRDKLALTIALASFAVVTALGVGFAGAEGLSGAEGLDGSGAPSLEASSQCANGIDDDGDGLVDAEDPDCLSSDGASEDPNGQAGAPEEGSGVEAPSEATADGGPQEGATIHAGGAVHRNQPLGFQGGGGGHSGGVSAPSATAGIQLPASGDGNGGSQYGTGGTPTAANPTTTIAPFGAAPIGVPNFVIDSFEIPPFLLPIYQACGTEYGVPWEVLAAINKLETNFGTNLGTSTAGAIGWMQFLPSSWKAYGLDANGDGREDPYNPVDAICAAAHLLHVDGAGHDLYGAIFSYNHADWYVQEVLANARAYGKLPPDLVGSLTGLTEGAHFPVAADATYADDLATREALKRSSPGAKYAGAGADVISSSPTRRGINIFAHQGAPVVAVNDGVIKAMGSSPKLGRYIVLEDAYGNRYIYAELGQIVRSGGGVLGSTATPRPLIDSQNLRPRLYALPGRAASVQGDGKAEGNGNASTLRVGSRVMGGAVVGRVGEAGEGVDPHLNFSIAPAGAGANRIDPKPILDGWKLLEATAIYRANGKSPFASTLSGAGVLLLSKEALQKRVLADNGLDIYPCGREDIAAGRIDRRVLAMLEYLRSKGFRLRISALECGHSYLTSSGNVSEHSSGDAVDIAEIDGVPVTGHQGPGTLTDKLIRDVLALQGTMHPHQVISLEDLPGETSFAMADHYDHVHVGYYPEPEGGYVNPFLDASEGRVGDGMTFTGSGAIVAIGDAEILKTGAPGWSEGGGVLYRLLDGSHAGQIIYVYKGLVPTVRAGERIAVGQRIATYVPGGSIEVGFANANGIPLAHAAQQEGSATDWGKKMVALLNEIGGNPFFSGLSANKWNRLIARLGEIPNPEVPTGPSQYAVPDSSATTAKSGSDASKHGED